jgi:hypothetical protein
MNRWILLMIHNAHTQICKNCVHYIPSEPGTCRLFGTKDMVTGLIKYENAETCRVQDWRCGTEATLFEFEQDITKRYTSLYISELKVVTCVIIYILLTWN